MSKTAPVELELGLTRSQLAADKAEEVKVSGKIRVTPAGARYTVKGVDFCVLLDTSGSMANPLDGQATRISGMLKAIDSLIEEMDANDRLSLIEFNTSASVFIEFAPATDANKQMWKARLNAPGAFSCSGQTNLEAGMKLALSEIESLQRPMPFPTIFLACDGEVNCGQTDMLELSQELNEEMQNFVATGMVKGFKVAALGIGDDIDAEALQEFRLGLHDCDFDMVTELYGTADEVGASGLDISLKWGKAKATIAIDPVTITVFAEPGVRIHAKSRKMTPGMREDDKCSYRPTEIVAGEIYSYRFERFDKTLACKFVIPLLVESGAVNDRQPLVRFEYSGGQPARMPEPLVLYCKRTAHPQKTAADFETHNTALAVETRFTVARMMVEDFHIAWQEVLENGEEDEAVHAILLETTAESELRKMQTKVTEAEGRLEGRRHHKDEAKVELDGISMLLEEALALANNTAKDTFHVWIQKLEAFMDNVSHSLLNYSVNVSNYKQAVALNTAAANFIARFIMALERGELPMSEETKEKLLKYYRETQQEMSKIKKVVNVKALAQRYDPGGNHYRSDSDDASGQSGRRNEAPANRPTSLLARASRRIKSGLRSSGRQTSSASGYPARARMEDDSSQDGHDEECDEA